MPEQERSRIEATFTERSALPDGAVRIVCSPTPLALTIDGEPVTWSAIEAERDALAAKTASTKEDRDRLALLDEAAGKHEPHLRATVTLDSDPGPVAVRGRSWWSLRTAAKAAGVKHPYHTVWVDGADRVRGTIAFPKTTYSAVYTIRENEYGNLEIVYLKEHKPDGGREPPRPYYVREKDCTIIYMDGFSGAGTEEDPWQVANYTDLTKVGCGDVSGDYEGWDLDSYYEQTGDISCPVETGLVYSSTDTTITAVGSPGWDEDEWVGKPIYVETGGVWQRRIVSENTANTITVSAAWDANPENLDLFGIRAHNFAPVGTESVPFSGQYDGSGKTIWDFHITTTSDRQGLFAVISGTVTNVKMVGIDITTGTRTGAITGFSNAGTISHCSATGRIAGGERVGGLVGQSIYAGSSITDCYAAVDVVVSTTARTGGFVGYGYQTTILRSYSLGTVTGGGDGFLGSTAGSTTTNNFAINTSHATITGATSKTAAELKKIATFTDWDIAKKEDYDGETWWIDEDEDYPRLGYEYEGDDPIGDILYTAQAVRTLLAASSYPAQSCRSLTSATSYPAQTQRSIRVGASYAGQAIRRLTAMSTYSGQTSRGLTAATEFVAQTVRSLRAATEYPAQAIRSLTSWTEYPAQAIRSLTAWTEYAAQTIRTLTSGLDILYRAQVIRNLRSATEFSGQTRRCLTSATEYPAQTARIITVATEYSAQTVRTLQALSTYPAQAVRRLTAPMAWSGQTVRRLTVATSYTAQTSRSVRALSEYVAQTGRTLRALSQYAAQTLRRIISGDEWTAPVFLRSRIQRTTTLRSWVHRVMSLRSRLR